MSERIAESVWTTAEPDSWPEPPGHMTVTALVQIERCPRQWALMSATYPSIWDRQGYPQQVHVAGLLGRALHTAVEIIIGTLADAGCASVLDPLTTEVMRTLGGYSTVIDAAIERTLEECAGNPRASRIGEFAARTLRSRSQELRGKAQAIVARLTLVARPPSKTRRDAAADHRAAPLTVGAYSELTLRVPEISWKGRVDLLVVSRRGCEITDFKTGDEDPSHVFQVRVYALLWSLEHERNPSGTLATRIVLAYRGKDKEIPAPTSVELISLREEVVARGLAARSVVSKHPVEARPQSDTCPRCGVRQLCDAYWQSTHLGTADNNPQFIDLQVRIVRQHGSSSWDAVVERAPGSGHVGSVLLRTSGRDIPFRSGERIRVLDARVQDVASDSPDEGHVIVMVGALSEVFALE